MAGATPRELCLLAAAEGVGDCLCSRFDRCTQRFCEVQTLWLNPKHDDFAIRTRL